MKTQRNLLIAVLSVTALAITNPAICTNKKNICNEQVVVTIKGNVKNTVCNNQKHTVTGYTVEISNPLYTTDDFACFAPDSVSAISEGIYRMGISSTDFININTKFNNVVFAVEDGYLCIKDDMSDNSINLTQNK